MATMIPDVPWRPPQEKSPATFPAGKISVEGAIAQSPAAGPACESDLRDGRKEFTCAIGCFAKNIDVTRTGMIARGLKAVLTAEGKL